MTLDELIGAYNRGMLDLTKIDQDVKMKERELYLQRHTYRIYQGSDGAWYTYVLDVSKKTGRKLIRRVKKEDLEDTIINIYKEQETAITEQIKDVFDEWNERRLSLGKIKNATFTRNEQIFNRHFSELGTRDITTITSEEFSNFLEEQISRYGLGARAFSNLKSICRGFLKRAKKRCLISWSIDLVLSELDISEREFKKTVKDDSEEIFYDDEMTAIMDYCYCHRDDICCLGVALMFATGMRVGEVVALEVFDIAESTVTVTKSETKYRDEIGIVYEVADYPKTPAGVRKVIVPDKYQWVLDALRSQKKEGYAFVGSGGKRLHTQAIRKRVTQICKALRIPERSPHKIRKTYGSILLDSGVDSKFIEKQMGHTDVMCTENYYHRDRRGVDQKRDILNKIPQFM